MQVFAGTNNLTGALDITVTKAGKDTTLGKVQSLILQAEQTKIPIMRIIDSYVKWYTPTVLMIAGIALFFTRDINIAISILVISCPCGADSCHAYGYGGGNISSRKIGHTC